ncbi:MAG: glycine betaine/L-proline ABC transporter ATP-binding protein [Trueperella sp.]|nr:glycine betaine/L-proline ABC transporter ATP-binding protein [Trueperella sp.]
MKAVTCRNVYKIFGKDEARAVKLLQAGASTAELPEDITIAVRDVSFAVEKGEIFVVMGLSGSGKSSLLRTLNALGPASCGTVEINGEDITKMSRKQIREIREKSLSMVFQNFALLPHRTVLENAAYPLEIQGIAEDERKERAKAALETTGLTGWEDNYPAELSGGMQQRVGLARALCADGDILLMDEAFSALDPLIRRDMQELLLSIQEKSPRTIIFITHDLNEAMYLGDRIAVMRSGSIDQIGTAEEILTNPANDYIRRFVADVDRSRVITASSVMVRPLTRLYGGDGPHVILHKLQEADAAGGWVVASGTNRLFGRIIADDVVQALRKNPQLSSISDLISTAHPGVSPDTPLSEVVAPAADQPVPVPVVSDDGRLLGVIPRALLLEALSQDSDYEQVDVAAQLEVEGA